MQNHTGTFVLSRSPGGGAERREFEDGVRDALVERGGRVLIVPHLYYLTSDHPGAEALAGLDGPVVVAGWSHPRAARWTVETVIGSGLPGNSFHDLDQFCCPGKGTEKLLARMQNLGGATVDGQGSVREITGPVDERWYPVVDYSRCSGCGQCMEFCLFGVYSRQEDAVVATSPDNCKLGCPACARVCPQGAIMFPHYEDDPAIAGAPGMEVETGQVDVAEFFRSKAQAADNAECDCDSGEAAETSDEAAERSDAAGDDLDELIEELDKLND